MKSMTYVFHRNIEGETNWTDGANCKAGVVSLEGHAFIRLQPMKPNRPWGKVKFIPMTELHFIEELSGYIPQNESTDRKPAIPAASEAPGGTVAGELNLPRRGRPPKAAAEE